MTSNITEGIQEIKPTILRHCANIFTNHFCTKNFNLNDTQFVEMVNNFDDIFWEVNQGYAADFLPFLMPLHQKNLQYINGLTHKIRKFVLGNIIGDRYENYQSESPGDYVESLIQYVKTAGATDLTWDMALFALEDILGGHSAVGNFLVKLLAFLVKEPEVQKKIQEEIDSLARTSDGFREITISDRAQLPYTEAVIFEAIRLIASPIVPRVANQDSSINGKLTNLCTANGKFTSSLLYRLQNRKRNDHFHEQLRLEYVRKSMGRTRKVQTRTIRGRRSSVETRTFPALRWWQKKLHGI